VDIDVDIAVRALLDLNTPDAEHIRREGPDNGDVLPGTNHVRSQTPDAARTLLDLSTAGAKRIRSEDPGNEEELPGVKLSEEKKQEGRVRKVRKQKPTFAEVSALCQMNRKEVEQKLDCSTAHVTSLLRTNGIHHWHELRKAETNVPPATPQPDAWTFPNEDPHYDSTSIQAVVRRLHHAVLGEWLNQNASDRLLQACELLIRLQENRIVTFETPARDPSTNNLSPDVSIFGWAGVTVHSPEDLNVEVRKMIQADVGGVWKKANGKGPAELKNPTWVMYELFRKIGVKPGQRKPAENDPGNKDMLHHKKWEFRNDESFRKGRRRLAKSFKTCPEKGGRERKRTRRAEPVLPVAGPQHANGPTGVSSQANATG